MGKPKPSEQVIYDKPKINSSISPHHLLPTNIFIFCHACLFIFLLQPHNFQPDSPCWLSLFLYLENSYLSFKHHLLLEAFPAFPFLHPQCCLTDIGFPDSIHPLSIHLSILEICINYLLMPVRHQQAALVLHRSSCLDGSF